ncbi:MAG: ribonuclease Z [Clostridia bacterium]|nr:ribonuclease Z [Clostridia bacterium]
MKLHFLGTCAGTEPMLDRKHASVAVECDKKLYWFDAGEGCSYTGHNMGLDLLDVKNIIISHTHMDHIGGLGNLLWNIRKLTQMRSELPHFDGVDVFIPNEDSKDGLLKLLSHTEENFCCDYENRFYGVQDGVLLDDGKVKVTAYHNTHLVRWETDKPLSYSYRIEAEGKSVVYSGDVGLYTDLDPVIGDGCDALLIETGHFGIDIAYDYIKDKNVKRVFFTHNGREIINDREGSLAKVARLFEGRGTICEDTLTVEL